MARQELTLPLRHPDLEQQLRDFGRRL